MARFTYLSAGVVFRINLWERRRLREVRFVTASAQDGGVRQLRLDVHWICGVFGQRPMAGFTMNSGVLAGLLGLHDIVVAVFADLLPGILHRSCGNFFQGGSPIMSVLTEGVRHQSGPQSEKDGQPGNKDGG